MQDFGLLDKMKNDALFRNAAPCLRKIEEETNNKIKDKKKRLTLEGLSGAFLVLGIGYSIAIAAFIVEVVHGFMRKRNQTQIRRIDVKPKSKIINRFKRADKKKDKKIVKNTKPNPLLVVNQQVETNVKIEDSTINEVTDIKPKPLATDDQIEVTIAKDIGKIDEAIDIKSNKALLV